MSITWLYNYYSPSGNVFKLIAVSQRAKSYLDAITNKITPSNDEVILLVEATRTKWNLLFKELTAIYKLVKQVNVVSQVSEVSD